MRPDASRGFRPLAIAVALARTVRARDLVMNESRSTLKGITALGVVVEDVAPDLAEGGLTTAQLRTDVELCLRQAGIPFVPSSESACVLSVLVGAEKSSCASLYGYTIQVKLNQPVRLLRDPTITFHRGTTWSIGAVGTVASGHLHDIRLGLRDLMDYFVTAYLEQNPKP